MSKGAAYEIEVANTVEAELALGNFGLDPALAKVRRKPAYFSRDRKKDIIFDVSIEVYRRGVSIPYWVRVGPGRAVVRVTAEVNFQHQKTKKESYDPNQRVLVKETVTNRKAISGAPANRGAAGAVTNLPKKTSSTSSTSQHPSNENEENKRRLRSSKVFAGLLPALTPANLDLRFCDYSVA
jgi:hypothetical protein